MLFYNDYMNESGVETTEQIFGPLRYKGGRRFRKDTLENAKAVADERRQVELDRREALRAIREGIEVGSIPQSWEIKDSSLDDLGDKNSYEETFRKVVPPGFKNLRSYVETVLADRRGHAVGIDLGGPGRRVFSRRNWFRGFRRGFFERSLGLTLVDHRSEIEKLEDTMVGHDILEGNLLNPESGKIIERWLSGRKADVIFERLAGGLAYEGTPADPYLILDRVQSWYSMLAPNGLMFLQVPEVMRPLMPGIVERISQIPTLQIMYDPRISRRSQNSARPDQVDHVHHAMSVRKFPGAPESVQLLSPRTVQAVYNAAR